MNKLFRHKAFPISAQLFLFVIFAGLLSISLGVFPESPEMVKILRNTNLANLTVWAFWWPLIIITALLFGRWWCTICPLELITSLTSMIGLKRKPGKFLKSGWLITILYAVILIVIVETFLVHRIPHRMALYLCGLIVLSILSGFIWEKRTFCNYICPVGHLLGLYSMLSFFGLKVKSPTVCKSCKTKDCFDKTKQYQLTGRSCTSNLNPSKSTNPVQCIYCTQCMTACPHENLRFGSTKPLNRFKNLKLSPSQAVFLLLISGFLIPELLEDNEKLFRILAGPAEHLNLLLQSGESMQRLIKFSWFIIGMPGLLLSITAILNKFIQKVNFKQSLTQLSLYMLPAIAFLHAYKGLTKIIKRIPYVPHALSDPKGIDTANAILQEELEIKSTVVNMLSNSVHILGPVIAMISAFVILEIFRRNTPKGQGITLSISIIYTLAFAIGLSL